MAVQFREKALTAYETMPSKQRNKVSQVIEQLDIRNTQDLNPYILKNQDLEMWVVRVDDNVRLLFTKKDRDFLIVDIIDRKVGNSG